MNPDPGFERDLDAAARAVSRAVGGSKARPEIEEVGEVRSVGPGTALVAGLGGVAAEELCNLGAGSLGMALDLDPDEIGMVLLDQSDELAVGDEVRGTGAVLACPVGEELLGRVVDPLGRPLDDRPAPSAEGHRPCERDAAPIIERAPVTVPLRTGIKAVDALVPVGRGQRELILGDRQTGKTSIAVDTIANQRDQGVICCYCAIGQRSSAVAKVVDELRRAGALDRTVVVVARGEDPPGLQFVAPYAATTMAEYFAERGEDVLIVYDDLTRHARAYRELSLLLRRPPGREAFPGDIFYVHSRLLERSTRWREQRGGGSLTALPIAETEAGNIAGYIPTNLISITDGQLVCSTSLFQRGVLPAIDVGASVSRVGGKTQLPALRAVAGKLRLAYAQFGELENFARFSTRLEESTRRSLERGLRIRELLKQPQAAPLTAAEEVAVLAGLERGIYDGTSLDRIAAVEAEIRRVVTADPDFVALVEGGEVPDEDRLESLFAAAGFPSGKA